MATMITPTRAAVRWLRPVPDARRLAVAKIDFDLVELTHHDGIPLWLGKAQLAQLGGFAAASAVHDLDAAGRLIAPDVVFEAPSLGHHGVTIRGWHGRRIHDWLVAAGRVDEQTGEITTLRGRVGGRKATLSRSDAAWVREQASQGRSAHAIAAELGIAASTVYGYLSRKAEHPSHAWPDPTPWDRPPERYWSMGEVAYRFGISNSLLRRWVVREKIPPADALVGHPSRQLFRAWVPDTLAGILPEG